MATLDRPDPTASSSKTALVMRTSCQESKQCGSIHGMVPHLAHLELRIPRGFVVPITIASSH